MADQSGDTSGVSPSSPAVSSDQFSTPQFSTPSQFSAPLTPVSTQALPSAAPSGGGGGAASAPGVSAPIASPAGFDVGTLSPQSVAELGSPNPAATATAQNVLGGADPSAPAATAGGAPAGGNSILNAIRNPGFDTIANAVGGNLGPLASLGILGFEAANKPGGIGGSGQQLPAAAQPGPTAGALVNQAGALQTAGQALSTPLATGVLPPQAQSSIDQVTKEQEAQIRQQFASMGLSGSSMEASAIANVQQQAQAQGFKLAQEMAQQGLGDLSLSSSIFTNLLNSGLQSDQEFQQSLTQFAASLAGGSGAKAA